MPRCADQPIQITREKFPQARPLLIHPSILSLRPYRRYNSSRTHPRMLPSVRQEQENDCACRLLALPNHLLLAVLQCLAAADDKRSLFSTARAHSRLHHAASQALSSITVQAIKRQHQLDGVLLFLGKHARHIKSISLGGAGDMHFHHGFWPFSLRELSPQLELASLHLHKLQLQLHASNGCDGVLGYNGVSALKQLRLTCCTLLDPVKGLTLSLPPGLQHLCFQDVFHEHTWWHNESVSLSLLQQPLQLTHLEMLGDGCAGSLLRGNLVLQGLSQLVDLRLENCSYSVTASRLCNASLLTRLDVYGVDLEPAALANKPHLQHLDLGRRIVRSAAGVGQLLSQLAALQQLTRLSLDDAFGSGPSGDEDVPAVAPAAAYSALTASSKLWRLDIRECLLPAGAWQHMFPAGRRLPHLTALDMSEVYHPPPWRGDQPVAAPEGSRLVSCCPALQSLDMFGLTYTTELLASLQQLSGLRRLQGCGGESRKAMARLAGLRPSEREGAGGPALLLHLAQLKQLTALTHGPRYSALDGKPYCLAVKSEAPGDEPVWRQVLRHLSNCDDPAVAQQAAAALAE